MVEVSSRKVLFLRRHTQAAEHIEMMPIAVFGMADVRCGTNGSNAVLARTARSAQKLGPAVLLCVRDGNNVTIPITAGQVWSQLLTSKQCSQTLEEDGTIALSGYPGSNLFQNGTGAGLGRKRGEVAHSSNQP